MPCVIHFAERSLPVEDEYGDIIRKMEYATRADNEHYTFTAKSGFGKRCLVNAERVEYVEACDV